MVLTLEPARFIDGDAIAHVLVEPFNTMRMHQRLFPSVSLADKTANAKRKWPASYAKTGRRHNKVVDGETGEIVSYASWDFVNVDALDVVSDISDIPADLETGAPPRSKGVDKELADAVEKQMQGLMPEELKTRPYMILGGISTLSKCQGSGAGSMQMRWGAAVADEKQVPIYVEAAEEAAPFYTRHGYATIKTVEVDMGPEDRKPYIISSMMREPKGL